MSAMSNAGERSGSKEKGELVMPKQIVVGDLEMDKMYCMIADNSNTAASMLVGRLRNVQHGILLKFKRELSEYDGRRGLWKS